MTTQKSKVPIVSVIGTTLGLIVFILLYRAIINRNVEQVDDIILYLKGLILFIILLVISCEFPENPKRNNFTEFLITFFFSIPFLCVLFPFQYSFLVFLIYGFTLVTFLCYQYIKSHWELSIDVSLLLFLYISFGFLALIWGLSRFDYFSVVFSTSKIDITSITVYLVIRFLSLALLIAVCFMNKKKLYQYHNLKTLGYNKNNPFWHFIIGIVINQFGIRFLFNVLVSFGSFISEKIFRAFYSFYLLMRKVLRHSPTVIAYLLLFTLCTIIAVEIIKFVPLLIEYIRYSIGSFKILLLIVLFLSLSFTIKFLYLYGMLEGRKEISVLFNKTVSSFIIILIVWAFTSLVGISSFLINSPKDYKNYLFSFSLLVLVLILFLVVIFIPKQNNEEVEELHYPLKTLNYNPFKDYIPYISLIGLFLSVYSSDFLVKALTITAPLSIVKNPPINSRLLSKKSTLHPIKDLASIKRTDTFKFDGNTELIIEEKSKIPDTTKTTKNTKYFNDRSEYFKKSSHEGNSTNGSVNNAWTELQKRSYSTSSTITYSKHPNPDIFYVSGYGLKEASWLNNRSAVLFYTNCSDCNFQIEFIDEDDVVYGIYNINSYFGNNPPLRSHFTTVFADAGLLRYRIRNRTGQSKSYETTIYAGYINVKSIRNTIQ